MHDLAVTKLAHWHRFCHGFARNEDVLLRWFQAMVIGVLFWLVRLVVLDLILP